MVGGPPCSYHVGVRERRWLPTGAVFVYSLATPRTHTLVAAFGF